MSSPNVFALQLVESEDAELADMECTAYWKYGQRGTVSPSLEKQQEEEAEECKMQTQKTKSTGSCIKRNCT